MKITTILVAAVSAGTLFAQSSSQDLDARIQVFGEFIRPLAMTVAPGVKDQAGTSAGFGMRFMGEIASARNWYYEIGGKLDSSSKLTLNNAVGNLTDVKITDSYWAVGAGYLLPLGQALSLGFHLEGRGEALAAQGQPFDSTGAPLGNPVSAGTTYLRPWGRLSFDATFRLGSLRPFIGAEVAGTPVKTTQNQLVALQNMDDRTLKSMAPSSSAAVYFGFHF